MKSVSLFLLLLTCSVSGQNYIEYQKTFNRIDEDIHKEEYATALIRLDSIYSNYSFIYAKHCIKALQICCKVNDSTRADMFLAKCFTQGVSIWIVRSNGLTNNCLLYSTTQNTIEHYDSLHAIYKSSINSYLAKQIDSLMTIDQRFTKKVNDGFLPLRYTVFYPQWKQNNKKQAQIIQQLTNKYGFPGERLIGLPSFFEDSVTAARSILFYGPTIFDQRAIIMLIHYYSTPRKDMNEVLYKNIVTGYLPVDNYATINDFMARWGKGKYGKFEYYNTWQTDPNPNTLNDINHRRNLIGLNDYAQQQANLIENRNYRKNKIMNFQIINE